MDEFQQTSDDETVDTCDMSHTTDVTESVDPQHVDHSYFTDQADAGNAILYLLKMTLFSFEKVIWRT